MGERRCPRCGSKGVIHSRWEAKVIDRQARINGRPPIQVMTTIPVFECLKCGHKWEEG